MPAGTQHPLTSLALSSILLAGLALGTQPAAAQPAPKGALQLLKDRNIQLWPQVLEAAGVTQEVQASAARYAAFVPTDAAVRTFLDSMGLTVADLKARPALAKHLIAQHLVLALTPEDQARLLEGKLTAVATAGAANGTNSRHAALQVQLAPSADGSSGATGLRQRSLTVQDAQGQTARGVGVIRVDANKVIVLLDQVLLSGHFYPNLARLCAHRGNVASQTCEALARSGVVGSLASPRFNDTLFFPGSLAWADAALRVNALSGAQLAPLVKFHVVPGLHAFPEGFANNSRHATLLRGGRLEIQYETANDLPSGMPGMSNLTAFVVTPSKQQRVPVLLYNVFVGRGIAHGIPEVLIPPGYDLAAARAAQLTAGAPRAAQQPGAAGHHHRRRLAFNEPALVTMKLNAAETAIRDRVRSQFREDEDRWR